jgi:hypothetical protein
MALRRNVPQEGDSTCELYVDTLSDVSDNSDNESDSDVPTNSLCKQLWSCAVVITSDSETSIEEEENSEPESSDDKRSDVWCKTDNNQAMSLSLEPQVWVQ